MIHLSPTQTYGIVGDIHQQIHSLKRLITAHPHIDHWVFLGDWFDDFTPEVPLPETIECLIDLLMYDNATCLWGNHDLSYRWEWARCAGWTWPKQCVIDGASIPWERFHLGACIKPKNQKPWLFTHAGISGKLYKAMPTIQDVTIDILEAEHYLQQGIEYQLLMAGADRGGPWNLGGCLWQDWASHEPIPIIRQCVGHTPALTTREKGEDYCIDTRLVEFAIWKNGEVRIQNVLQTLQQTSTEDKTEGI